MRAAVHAAVDLASLTTKEIEIIADFFAVCVLSHWYRLTKTKAHLSSVVRPINCAGVRNDR